MLHRVVLCLLLVLLPLRSLLAAGHLACEPTAQATQQRAEEGHGHGHHAQHDHQDDTRDAAAANPCKVCAPCCLTAAPPPVLALDTAPVAPAARVALAPDEHWNGIVPPLPDPPPRV